MPTIGWCILFLWDEISWTLGINYNEPSLTNMCQFKNIQLAILRDRHITPYRFTVC